MLPEYQAQAKQLEEKVDAFKRLAGMEEKVDRLGKELQWAMVTELQKVRLRASCLDSHTLQYSIHHCSVLVL